jgi:methanogenic corrinoid protein MtbC1
VDEARVRAMQRHLDAGVSAAQAARLALAERADVPTAPAGAGQTPGPGRLEAGLRDALDRFDETAAHTVADRLLAAYTLRTVLRDVLLPYLRELGERWERGDVTVAQEHFASNLIRGRLLGLARDWGAGDGPRAILACAPGELHDLPLIMFGLSLAARGWSITYLGQDTPIETILPAVRETDPRLVLVTATAADRLRAVEADLRVLATETRVALAGAGADEELARAVGASVLEGDPVTAAERVADGHV